MEPAVSRMFEGTVLLEGETGDGLESRFDIDDDSVRLTAGETVLGSWKRSACDVTPSGKGSFHMILDGESLTFTPAAPSSFAETMSVPIVPVPVFEEPEPAPTYDYDAAIDKVVTAAAEANGPVRDADMLSKPVVVGIAGVSGALIVSLVAMSTLL